MKEKRLNKVLEIIRHENLDACVLKGMDNIFYLTGFRGSEGLILVTKGDVVLLTDSRYITHAREVAKGCTIVETKGRDQTLGELLKRYGIARIGFDSCHTTYQMYLSWKDMAPDVEFVTLNEDIESIRGCKDPDEILAVRKAIDIATKAFNAVFEKIVPGKTEKEIANELDYAMRCFGADRPSFDTIVASGPRGALPHAQPSDKVIDSGETIVIDFGCQLDGYCSDETCTVAVGSIPAEMQEIYYVVREAQQKGIQAVRTGFPVRELDTIVRGYVEEKGYGEFFRHGTGHGIGIAVHEAPAITTKSDGVLEENMIVTIEPGIYIPNRGGVRLEDMVLVHENGGEVLTHLRKDLFEIQGGLL